MYRFIGPVSVYFIFYFSSIVIHFIVSWWLSRRLGLSRRVWIIVSTCYLLGMTIGAKALYDLQHGYFDLWALFSLRHYAEGGLWGGLLAYFVLASPLAWMLAYRKPHGLDLVGLSIPIPMVLCKFGCLFNGCCYGHACSLPWAITFPEGSSAPAGVPLHPTQIYEMLVLLGVLVVFYFLDYKKWQGTMLLWFLILYGIGRTGVDMWRGDTGNTFHIGVLTLTQLICLLVAGVSIPVLFFWHRYLSKSQKVY